MRMTPFEELEGGGRRLDLKEIYLDGIDFSL